jgi:hypothetical protein
MLMNYAANRISDGSNRYFGHSALGAIAMNVASVIGDGPRLFSAILFFLLPGALNMRA